MNRIEIFKKMALMSAHFQLGAELIEEIEGLQPMFTGLLKRRCNMAKEEMDKALNQLLKGDEAVQLEGLSLANKLEQAYKETYDSVYTLTNAEYENGTN